MKTTLSTIALLVALSAPAFAQTAAAPAAASGDPIVQMRADQRAANAAYATGLIEAYKARSAKVAAAVEAAVKDADAKGKDPLVAKRDAEAKATKATQAEYDANLKKLKADHKAALDAAAQKGKSAKLSAIGRS
jgi:anti-sigma-K factor RskA